MRVTTSSFARRSTIAALAFAAAACSRAVVVPPAPEVKEPPAPDGRGVIGLMHDRWAGKWYMSLTFKQNTVIIAQNRRETKAVWNEYILLPGRLRIDYLPLSTRSGVLYADGMMYGFTNGRPQTPQRGWNPLLTLMGDVYTQLPDTTAWQLDSLGFDLSIARRDTWEGKPAWVVGAAAGDTTTSQFWVDVDSLLIRRIIQRDARAARPVVSDTRFQNYRDVGGYPVAFAMRFYRDGRLYFREDYFNVRVGETLPIELFEPQHWVSSQLKR